MSVHEPSCEQLMSAYVDGDLSAFEALFARHRRSLFHWILSRVESRAVAEDLFQEAFLRVVRRRSEYRASGAFQAWLFTIARNVLMDHYRRTGRRSEGHTSRDAEAGTEGRPESIPDASPEVDPARRGQALELGERIEAALRLLPEEQRDVFLLREVGGLDFKGIAEVVGCALPTAKSRMRYALAALRSRLVPVLDATEGDHGSL